jgi:hypothetical protein
VARRVGEEWRGTSEKRGVSGMGATRRGGGVDDGGREAIWGKQLSADMEGDGASLHRTPNLSSRVDPRLKAPTRDKRRISRGMP